MFKLPTWVTPAVAFNNTTSLPLLLFQALATTGMLSGLLEPGGDSISAAVDRAESYFLVNAIVSDCLTFAIGPKLLSGNMGNSSKPRESEAFADGETGNNHEEQDDSNESHEANGGPDERTSLLPDAVQSYTASAQNNVYTKGEHFWNRLHPWAQSSLDFAYQFVNAPTIGALIGAVIGLVPALHKAFFADSGDGGFLNAWLTKAIQNVGDLFAALQIIVVGVKLSSTMRRMKRGEGSGAVSWKAMTFVTVIRFIIFPLISIPLFWAFATKTDTLGKDPILWFCLMLLATGPPALILLPLADVTGSDEHDKMSIAKFLTVSAELCLMIEMFANYVCRFNTRLLRLYRSRLSEV
jgi:predicted permease